MREREAAKACALAVQYGMGEPSLGQRIGQSTAPARELLERHRQTYQGFWRWSDAVVDFAALHGYLYTVFGWRLRVLDAFNDRSLRNFPMQANGAEMLRLACSFLTETGVRVCAPVHDAVLIEAPCGEIEAVADHAQREMARASAWVLDGFELRSRFGGCWGARLTFRLPCKTLHSQEGTFVRRHFVLVANRQVRRHDDVRLPDRRSASAGWRVDPPGATRLAERRGSFSRGPFLSTGYSARRSCLGGYWRWD